MDGALGGVEQAGDLFGIAGIRREEPHGDRGAGLCLGFTALGCGVLTGVQFGVPVGFRWL